MKTTKTPGKYYGYNNYRGTRCWEVSHPEHQKPVIVRAATATQAMMAAAHVWNRDWKPLSFHVYVRVKEREDLQKQLEG